MEFVVVSFLAEVVVAFLSEDVDAFLSLEDVLVAAGVVAVDLDDELLVDVEEAGVDF